MYYIITILRIAILYTHNFSFKLYLFQSDYFKIIYLFVFLNQI